MILYKELHKLAPLRRYWYDFKGKMGFFGTIIEQKGGFTPRCIGSHSAKIRFYDTI